MTKNLFSKLFLLTLMLGSMSMVSAQINEWAQSYSSETFTIYDVAYDPSGNVFYAGLFSGTVDFDPSASTSELTSTDPAIYILKMSSAGSFISVKHFESRPPSTQPSTVGALKLLPHSSGVYIMAQLLRPFDLDPSANDYLTSNTTQGGFLISLDSNGDLDFVKEVLAPSPGAVYFEDFAQRSNGDFVIVGGYRGTPDFDPGTGTVNETADGGTDPMVLTLDGNGDFVSVDVFGGSAGSDYFTNIDLDASENRWVVGTQRDAITVNGKTFNAPSSISTMLLKLDASGVASVATNWAANDFDVDIAVNSTDNSVFVTGYFTSAIDFDPGSGDATLTPSGRDIFLSKFSSSGDFEWAIQEGTVNTDDVYDLVADFQGNVHLGGVSESDILYNTYDSDGQLLKASAPSIGSVQAMDISGSEINLFGYFSSSTNNFDLCGGSLALSYASGSTVYQAEYTLEEFADTPSLSASKSTSCDGESVTISISSGSLNDATDWEWYSGSCGGTSVGSGTSVVVSPSVTTTYYVRAEGYTCNDPGSCASITITASESPTDISLTREAINENEIVGTLVGGLSSTDATSGDSHTYTLVTGTGDTDNASFAISGSSLNSAEVFDRESKDTYFIRIQSEDLLGCTYQEAFVISINDVTPEAPTDITLSNTSINENNVVNDVIGSFTTTDDDTGETFTYSLVSGNGDTDNASFNISGSDLRASESFDFETKSSYSVRVQTNDGNSGTFEKEFTISINNVIESENDILTFSIPEQTTAAEIDATDHTVIVTVPYNTDRSSLTPTLTVNTSASISPVSGATQNFNSSVVYTVTAEDGSQQNWTVTVIAPIPAGTYAIGAGQDFTSLSNLISYLNTNGISGDVVFELSTNQSSGSVFSIVDYPGTDLYSFTLQPADGISSVDINNAIRLQGVENFTIQGMGAFNIPSGGITVQNGVNDTGKTSKNVTISGMSMTSASCVWLRGVDGAIIDGNTMRGIAVSGATQIYRYANIYIGNTTEVKDVTIRNNDMFYGQVYNPSSTQSSVYGLRQADQVTGYLKMYNNTIHLNPAQTKGGIYGIIANADDIEIYHNTVLLEGGDGSTLNAECISATATNSVLIKNNILDVNVNQTGTSASISQLGIKLTDSSIPTVEMEDNNITFLNADRNYDGYFRLDLGIALDEDDLTTIESQFPGTTYSDVIFVDRDNNDYELDGISLDDFDLRGDFIASVATDIDGTSRNTYAPSKGAFEAPFNFIVWDGTTWSNTSGPSGGGDDVIIDGDYNMGTDGYFDSRDLTINSGTTMTIDGESSLVIQRNLINNGTLVVESGSSLLTYSPNTISGNDITFKRNTRYADGRYSFVGSPVEQDAGIVGSDLGTSVYKYNESTAYGTDGINRWEDASADELVPGKGYTQAFQLEIAFTGMPNQGTITIDGTYTEDTNDDYEGWVLVSNPYPAPIDVADFLSANTNTTGTIYIWDDNGSDTQRGTNSDYIVANGTMATNTTPAGGQTRYDQIMGSMQGCFVKLNSAADVEIEFNESMRVTGNSDDHFFRETHLPIARINLTSNDGLFKQTVIGLAEDATEDELNRNYDAQAFNATSSDGLFTMKAGRSLSLNGMTNDWEVIQLQVNTATAGIYEISVELEEYDQSMYLKDHLTGAVTDLRNDSYSFSTQAGISTDRFELLSNPSEVLGLESEKVLVYVHQSILYIQQGREEAREYQLFNMNGQRLLTKSVQEKEEINLSSYAKGIYLVFDGEKTHKIILD